MGKNPIQDPESGNIPDLIFKNLVSDFWVKNPKLFDADPDPGSCQPWIHKTDIVMNFYWNRFKMKNDKSKNRIVGMDPDPQL
jgi:hypothetical protein